MKTYPKYKESGIPWIGQILEEWEQAPLKYLIEITKGRKPISFVDEPIEEPYITMDYLRGRDNSCQYPGSVEGLVHIDEDETLVLWDGANAGEFLKARRGYLASTMAAIRIKDKNLLPSYLFLFLKSGERYSKTLASGTTIPHFNPQFFDINIPVPPLAEQQAIAEYLDKKTGDIDELVGLLNKQIADVRAYRQSLITETVTQGLNKDVPMKDSGIEWIGQIPKGWHLTKLKHLTSKIGSGITPTGGATIYQDSGILFIRSQNVYTDGLRLDDVAYISDEIDNNMQSSRVLYGDVLLNITGASIGRCTTFNLERTRANVNQHVCIIRPIAELLLSKYLQYTLNSNLGQIQIALYQTGGNREGLNFEQLKNFLIPDIPLSEQQQIVEFLDAKTKDIDELLSKLEAQVADLLAYKSSLISEVVTGKIDIR